MEDRHAGAAGGADEQEDEGPRGEEEGCEPPDRQQQQQQRRQVGQRLRHESSDRREKDFEIVVSIFPEVVTASVRFRSGATLSGQTYRLFNSSKVQQIVGADLSTFQLIESPAD